MMMEPFDEIVNPLVNQMSSEEEKYFSIPANRNISRFKKYFGKKIFRHN